MKTLGILILWVGLIAALATPGVQLSALMLAASAVVGLALLNPPQPVPAGTAGKP